MKLNPFHIIGVALLCTAPVAAQEKISTDESGGFIVRFLEDSLSGDNRAVDVIGLSGTFSSRAQIERLTISDAEGVWLELEGAELDWNRTALLRGNLSVNQLAAKRVAVLRAPLPTPADPSLPTPEATPIKVPELPIAIKLNSFKVDQIELGAALIGQDSVWSLGGALSLIEGDLDAALDLDRLDREGDSLRLHLDVGSGTEGANVALVASEAAGGIVGSLFPLPEAPRLDLTLKGSGPLSDFRADLEFKAENLAKVDGQILLIAPDTSDSETPKGLEFSADLNGDIDALIPQVYRPFFGPDMRMRVKGEQFENPNGTQGIALHSLALSSKALRLRGTALVENGQLETANLRATVHPEEGQTRVILPVAGGQTSVSEITLTAQKATGPDWSLRADVDNLVTAGAHVGQARLVMDGQLSQEPFNLEAATRAQVIGLRLDDPALTAALGDTLQFETQLSADGQDFAARGLKLWSNDYAIEGDITVASWADGLKVSPDVQAEISNLARLAPLTGLDLSGTASAQLLGNYTPLSGAFAVDLNAQTQELATGIAQIDPMIAGSSALTFNASRDGDGLRVESFRLNAPGLEAKAAGQLSSEDGSLEISAKIADLKPLFPQASGPLEIVGDIGRQKDQFDGVITLKGPHSSDLKLTGTANLDGQANLKLDATLQRLERFLPQLSGSLTAKGSAQRDAGVWQVDLGAQGPAGVEAKVAGSWDETAAQADINAKGRLRLDVANLFIAPNLLTGLADFDLSLKGSPSLENVSGNVSTGGSRLVLPDAKQQVEDISGSIQLANSRASLNLAARPQDGGQLRIDGPVALTAPFVGDLSLGLDNVVVTDNLLYRTEVGGKLRLSGPLASAAVLTGQIDVGETNINIASAGGAIDAAPIPTIRHVGEPPDVYRTRARAGLTETGAASGSSTLALDLLINAPKRIFVRGRGLRAELGGSLQIRGSANAPEPAGQINLVRGSFDILGRRLALDDGQISLVGSLIPFLDFSASSNTSEGTANLRISGPLNAPRIEVTAEPNRPSEEALALLLFGDNVQDLSPLALARLAASAARLSGRSLGAQGKLEEETGVDDVDIGFDNLGTGELGLGGYAAENVYTDFNINTRGDSELSINLDLNQNLSVSGTVDSAGQTGIGLFFKRDY